MIHTYASTGLFGPSGPQPEDVSQRPWRRDCHLLSALQAIVARDPARLADSFEQRPDGWGMRCYPAISETTQIPVSRIQATVGIDRATLSRSLDTPYPWVEVACAAFARTQSRATLSTHQDPSDALGWCLGTQAETRALKGGASAATELLHVARVFEEGEAVVMHSKTHAYALVDVTTEEGLPVLHLRDNLDVISCGVRVNIQDMGYRWCAFSATLGAHLGKKAARQ